MNNLSKFITYCISIGLMNGIKSTKYTWAELGAKFNISGDAARKKWKRYMQTPKPDSIVEEYTPIKSTNFNSDGIYFVMGCVHAPFVNKKLWNSMLYLAREMQDKIAGVVLAGDFVDLNSLSSHDRGKMPIKGISLGWEYEVSNTYLDSIDAIFPEGIKKIWLAGNHENRHSRYMKLPDNKKLEGAIKSPTEALRLHQRGYEVNEDYPMGEFQLGDLSIYHGDAFSKHVCHAELNAYKKSVLFYHTHRIQSYIENGHFAYNGGCMADINSPVFNYASRAMKRTWRNGFNLVTLDNGKTTVEQIVWNNDHFYYGGVKYES